MMPSDAPGPPFIATRRWAEFHAHCWTTAGYNSWLGGLLEGGSPHASEQFGIGCVTTCVRHFRVTQFLEVVSGYEGRGSPEQSCCAVLSTAAAAARNCRARGAAARRCGCVHGGSGGSGELGMTSRASPSSLTRTRLARVA